MTDSGKNIDNDKQQEELEKTYGLMARKLLAGTSKKDCVKFLVKTGVPEEFAEIFIGRVYADTENFKKTPNYKKYLINTSVQRLVAGLTLMVAAAVLRIVIKSPVADGFSVAIMVFGLGYLFFGVYSFITAYFIKEGVQ
jgi:hypothetical protein